MNKQIVVIDRQQCPLVINSSNSIRRWILLYGNYRSKTWLKMKNKLLTGPFAKKNPENNLWVVFAAGELVSKCTAGLLTAFFQKVSWKTLKLVNFRGIVCCLRWKDAVTLVTLNLWTYLLQQLFYQLSLELILHNKTASFSDYFISSESSANDDSS